MQNELLLIGSMLVLYSMVIVLLKLFHEQGLYLWTVVATISANIEVLMVVKAFGMEMTLGNILFASTFLVTDIASELYGKKASQKAVVLGVTTSITFILISQSWMLYVPAQSDWATPAIREIFSNTPRMMLSSLIVYAIVQSFDVWAYHKWWAFTERKFGDSKRFLWLRNNGSTLLSQLANMVLFNLAAFIGIYDTKTLVSIILSGYAISIVTSLADTPFVYLARKVMDSGEHKIAREAGRSIA